MTGQTDPQPLSLVSVTIPIYNEEAVLTELVDRLIAEFERLAGQYRFEIILVDDGSSDRSLAVMRDLATTRPLLKVIELRRNYGQTAALQAGLDHARGDYIITMDGDLQHFPEEIGMFLAKLEEGFDVVCGWRHQRRENALRRWPSRMANLILRRISGLSIHDIGTTFRAYRAEIVKDIKILGENHRFIPVFASMAGARIAELKIENVARTTGRSSYGLGRTLSVLLDLFFIFFYVRFFDRPIRFFGTVALCLGFTAATIAGVIIINAFIADTPVPGRSGWVNLAMFLAAQAVTIMLVGILSEVMARLFYSSGENAPYRVRNVFASRPESSAPGADSPPGEA